MDKAYDFGVQAAKDGYDFWENPYSTRSQQPHDFIAWMAGWCYQMLEQEQAEELEKQ